MDHIDQMAQLVAARARMKLGEKPKFRVVDPSSDSLSSEAMALARFYDQATQRQRNALDAVMAALDD
ncbi:hypothetical protein [Solilutibacter silvestris]|uniref:hypothetical protein n=1 Tax=Solilutibacter silvestris TaxID=1645665 RepID=UPI00101AE1F6|nr:hypothetical protein [Lysobacter silvestris]